MQHMADLAEDLIAHRDTMRDLKDDLDAELLEDIPQITCNGVVVLEGEPARQLLECLAHVAGVTLEFANSVLRRVAN